jgi:hypothetical protein
VSALELIDNGDFAVRCAVSLASSMLHNDDLNSARLYATIPHGQTAARWKTPANHIETLRALFSDKAGILPAPQ